ERRVARILLPAILGADRAIASDVPDGAPDHQPVMVALGGLERAVAHGEIDQKHGQRRFVHLNAVPVRRAIQPHVLTPVAVGVLPKARASTNSAAEAVRSISPVSATLPLSARSYIAASRPWARNSCHPSEAPTKPADRARQGAEHARASA